MPSRPTRPLGSFSSGWETGLDQGDADYYDGMFAANLLWGIPYGQALSGYAPPHGAHHSQMNTPTISGPVPLPLASRRGW